MKLFFYKFWKNIANIFSGVNLIYHLIAIATTYIIVASGFDWKYYQFFVGTGIYFFFFSASGVGGVVPFIAPVAILIFGKIRKNSLLLNVGYALAQAAILGSFVSSLYKAFTGRLHPSLSLGSLTDITHVFRFGILRGGIFWGWPSSHTTIAFAMSTALWTLFPKNKIIRALAVVYPFYIGIGVSMTIHWFSDFVAGAIIGSVIGVVVGKSFKERNQLPD